MLTWEGFLEARRRDDAMLAAGKAPAGLSLCGVCTIPLQETSTGNRPMLDAEGHAKHVCSDCFFDEFDEVLTKHPVKSSVVLR